MGRKESNQTKESKQLDVDRKVQHSFLAWPHHALVESLIAYPGGSSLIQAQPHTFVEIDHAIFSTAILLLPQIEDGLLSVTNASMYTEYWLTAKSKLAQQKVWLGQLTV